MLWSQTENGYEILNPDALAVTITKKVCLAHLRGSRAVMQSIDGVDLAGGPSASDLTDEADMNAVKESLLSMLTPTQRQCYPSRVMNLLGCRNLPLNNVISVVVRFA